MRVGIRLILSVCVAGICVALSRRAADVGGIFREPARWFIPGPLGEERGRSEADEPAIGSSGFLTRAFSGLRGPEGAGWGRRNGLTASLSFSHHMTQVFPPELYARHPEFFPLLEGKRLEPPKGSWFWNPDIAREDVARYAADVARRHFEAHPGDVSFALGVNDALIWGESPELVALAGTPRKWFRERPDYSNVVFTFMNRAAEALARTHPDKYLGCLAYYWCENVPDFPVDRHVIPFLTADRSQGYDGAFWKEEMDLQDRWSRLAAAEDRKAGGSESKPPPTGAPAGSTPPRRLGMYDYLYGGGFLVPRIHTRLLAENLRHARRAGFTDYFAEVNPNWGLDGPMPWLTAQLVRNPEQSRAALLDEYYGRYFQDAAEPMRRFFEKCESLWMAQPRPAYWLKHYRNESQAIVFPPAARGELRMLLAGAGVLARSRKVEERIALVSDAFGVTERFCALYETRNRLLRLALEPAPRDSTQAADIVGQLGRYLEARRDFIRYTLALAREEPLALNPFLWDDYLMNDPVPLALAAIRHAAERPPVAVPPSLTSNPAVAPLWNAIGPDGSGRSPATGISELLDNPAMNGQLRPARMIAGLTYGVSLPAPWQSRAEPSEFHRAELTAGPAGGTKPGTERRVLRISGTKDTMVSQWVRIGGKAGPSTAVRNSLQRAEVSVRGRVSASTAVRLILAWLDEQQRHVGFKTVRLPDGDWPEFVTLRQAGVVPAGAVWVGIGLRVQNQTGDDWVEATGFSLKE